MHWKRFGRNRKRPNRGTIPLFARRDRGKLRRPLVKVVEDLAEVRNVANTVPCRTLANMTESLLPSAAEFLFDLCTNPERQVSVTTTFCTMMPNCGSPLCNLLHVSLLAPRFLRRLIHFWDICTPLYLTCIGSK